MCPCLLAGVTSGRDYRLCRSCPSLSYPCLTPSVLIVWIAFMETAPSDHTRYRALRRAAVDTRRGTSAAMGEVLRGQLSRMAAEPQDQGPLLLHQLYPPGVAVPTAEHAASRSRRSSLGSRGQPNCDGAPTSTPTSRGAPLGWPRHSSGRGRATSGPPVNRAAGRSSDSDPVGRVGSALYDARPPSALDERDGDGRGPQARATSLPLGRAEA